MVRLKWPQFSLHKTRFSPCYRPKYIQMELNFIHPKRLKKAKNSHMKQCKRITRVTEGTHVKLFGKVKSLAKVFEVPESGKIV